MNMQIAIDRFAVETARQWLKEAVDNQKDQVKDLMEQTVIPHIREACARCKGSARLPVLSPRFATVIEQHLTDKGFKVSIVEEDSTTDMVMLLVTWVWL